MVDDAIVGEWNLQSLPTDALSVQNGLITTIANRFPILIDPQWYVVVWLVWLVVVGCGGLWWVVVGCGGLWWAVVGCGGLWWVGCGCGRKKMLMK
jgi:ATP-binding dynein motor region